MSTPPSNDNRRSVKNILVAPRFQLAYGMYFFGFGLLILLIVFGIAFYTMAQMITSLGALSDIGPEMQMTLHKSLISAGVILAVMVIGFAVLAFVMGIVLTHRIAGPVVSLRRQITNIKNGNYAARVQLRDRDELQPLMTDLNDLAKHFEDKYGVETKENTGT